MSVCKIVPYMESLYSNQFLYQDWGTAAIFQKYDGNAEYEDSGIYGVYDVRRNGNIFSVGIDRYSLGIFDWKNNIISLSLNNGGFEFVFMRVRPINCVFNSYSAVKSFCYLERCYRYNLIRYTVSMRSGFDKIDIYLTFVFDGYRFIGIYVSGHTENCSIDIIAKDVLLMNEYLEAKLRLTDYNARNLWGY